MDDRFARAGDAIGAVDVGVVRQAIGGVLECLPDPGRGGDVTVGDLARVLSRSARILGIQMTATFTSPWRAQ